MSTREEIISQWEKIKTLVEQIEVDLLKSARGNSSAGVRTRKGLRLLKNWSADAVKVSLALEEARKAEKD